MRASVENVNEHFLADWAMWTVL